MKRLGSIGAVVLTALWARADAPPGRYTIANGTVRDNQTMLTWQQALDASTVSWAGAATYCMSLALDGGGFRVPSVTELQTIVEEGRAGPSIDTTAFPATPAVRFWTSSPQRNVAGSAWLVSFDDGEVTPSPTSTLAPVRCVR